MSQVAVTDHGNMFGALDFYTKAKAANIKPILGMEAYITGKAKHTDKIRENFHLVLLAENNIGYQNLKKLSSKAFLDGKYYFPRIDKDLLNEHKEGIIVSSACLGGEVGKCFLKNNIDAAREAVLDFKRILGPDNYFLEVQTNSLKEQIEYNAVLAQIAKDEGLRLNATNDCHYVTRDQHDAQNLLMAIRQQKTWDDPTLIKHSTDDFYIRSGEEMFDLLKVDYLEGFETACEIGKRCNVELDIGNTYLPLFPTPDNFSSEPECLREISLKGLRNRFKDLTYKVDQDKYEARLKVELDIIIEMGFSGYFLIVQDFINWAKNDNIRVGPGRGSGAGSLVAFALRITDVDPLPYDLLFERFLNPERVSMPDFDIDFMQERRGEVIKYVAQRYGRDHVGQIATYSALNPKSAVKDVARTLGIPFSEINELTKPMPLLVDGKKPSLTQALKFAPKLKAKAEIDQTYKRVLSTAHVLEGLFRQAGMHAGGVVIGEKELVDYVPLFSGQNNELITQFDKDKVELAGLVKFDFLGLKTLDVISNAENLVNERIANENKFNKEEKLRAERKHPHSNFTDNIIERLNVSLLPLDNSNVYKLISSGDTLGIFQVESPGFQELCRKLKPDSFEDIVAAVALHRPGPMQAGMVDDFVDRKHGRKKVIYPHPLLEQVLKPTYGTIVYQEQVMKSAQVLAGYSLGSADILRRAMGKKKFEEMRKQRAIFTEGALKNGVDAQKSSEIFDTIEKFAGYGFNKSHSAAYAMITYQTAYLKCFYPVEFMAALLTTSSGSTDDVVKYIHEARTNGIDVLPPDVNISHRSFTVDYNQQNNGKKTSRKNSYARIRFGLEAVKGLGDAALDTIIEARKEHGAFENIFHFCRKVAAKKVNKKVLEALIKSGGMDGFTRPRKQLFETVEKALTNAQSIQRDASIGQTNMFDMFVSDANNAHDENYTNTKEWSEKEKLRFERETLGFYLSGHPLDRYEQDARKLGAMPTINLTQSRQNESVQIVGIVVDVRERLLKSGKGRWAIATVEDNFAQAEVLCFNKSYEAAKHLLKSDEPLLFTGKALIDDIDDKGKQLVPKMRLKSVMSLSVVQIKRARLVRISISLSEVHEEYENLLQAIHEIFARHRGEKPVQFILKKEANYNLLLKCDQNVRVTPTDEFLGEIESLSRHISVVRI